MDDREVEIMVDLNETAILGLHLGRAEAISFGGLAILVVLLIVAVIILLRKADKAPDTLPPLTEHKDFKTIVNEDIATKSKRRTEIEIQVTSLKREYNALKDDLDKLERLKGHFL